MALPLRYCCLAEQDIRSLLQYCTGGTVYFALVVDPRDPPFRTRGLDLWDRSLRPGIISRTVGSIMLCWVARKNFRSQESADDACQVKSSQVVGLRDRVAIIRALLHAKFLPPPLRGLRRSEWGRRPSVSD